MTMKSAPFYWLECDTCGKAADYGDFTAMSDEASAIDYALDSAWTTDGERYNCHRCPTIAKCERCGKPAGDESGERDYHCEPCWAVVESEDAAKAGAT